MKINMPLYISICTTALSIGGLIGSLFYPIFLTKAGGENRLMALCDIFMIILLAFQLINLDIYQHSLTRLLQGIIIGVYGIVVPSYLMSISPTKISGQIASLNQIMITIGIAIGYCMGYMIDENDLANVYNWRICILVPLPMCLISAFIGQSFKFDRL